MFIIINEFIEQDVEWQAQNRKLVNALFSPAFARKWFDETDPYALCNKHNLRNEPPG